MSRETNSVRPEALEGRTSDTRSALDAMIDEALRELTAGRPRDGLRGRVLARLAEAPETTPTRVIQILGWRVPPFPLLAGGAAVGVLALAVVFAPRLWLARDAAPATNQVAETRDLPRAPVAPAAGPTSTGTARTTHAAVQMASAGPHQGALAARRRSDTPPTEAAKDAANVAGPIPPLRIEPLASPDEIAITPIEVEPVTISDITIQEIQIAPILGGRLMQ